jgi:hypothetical protein
MKHDDFDPDAEGCLYVGSASDEVSPPRRGTLRNLVLKAIALAPELSGSVRFEIETYRSCNSLLIRGFWKEKLLQLKQFPN